jgi:hypothetical protein
LAALILCAALVSSIGLVSDSGFGPATAWAGEEVTVDGVLHIKNGATPSQGVETLELEELWSVGGEDEEVFFGLISQVIDGGDGNIYLLDTQLSEVRVFSSDGEALKTLSREGEGPGEVRRPLDLLFMPDGSLGLVQTFPGKIIKIDKDGVPQGDLIVGGTDPGQAGLIALLDGEFRGGNLVLAAISITQAPPSGQKRTSFIASYSDTAEEKVRYLEKTTELDFANLDTSEKEQHFPAPRRWTVGPDGRVYVPPYRDEYVINVYAPDGSLERVIEREFVCPKRSAERQALYEGARDAQLRQIPGEAKIELSDSEPVIGGIHVTDDGVIWVIHAGSAHEQPDGILQTYDLFDAKGHFIKQVPVACQGDGEDDGLFFLGTDRMVLVTGIIDAAVAMQGGLGSALGDEEPEPMEVICYRIVG